MFQRRRLLWILILAAVMSSVMVDAFAIWRDDWAFYDEEAQKGDRRATSGGSPSRSNRWRESSVPRDYNHNQHSMSSSSVDDLKRSWPVSTWGSYRSRSVPAREDFRHPLKRVCLQQCILVCSIWEGWLDQPKHIKYCAGQCEKRGRVQSESTCFNFKK